MKVLPVWTLHLRDLDQKTKFEESLRNSAAIERLREIVLLQLENLEAQEMSEEMYEKENLDPRFHVNIGRKKELREILRLLTF